MITGASGGVGSAAIEVASRMGARVVAVIRDAGRRDYVTALGATSVVVDQGDGFHKVDDTADADVVLDCVGEPTMNASLRCLRLGGTAVVIGNIVPTERLSLNLGLVIVKALRIIGSSGASPRDMADLLELRGDRPFAMTLRELPLDEAESSPPPAACRVACPAAWCCGRPDQRAGRWRSRPVISAAVSRTAAASSSTSGSRRLSHVTATLAWMVPASTARGHGREARSSPRRPRWRGREPGSRPAGGAARSARSDPSRCGSRTRRVRDTARGPGRPAARRGWPGPTR